MSDANKQLDESGLTFAPAQVEAMKTALRTARDLASVQRSPWAFEFAERMLGYLTGGDNTVTFANLAVSTVMRLTGEED